ncbi:MAG: hypothetical protein GC161_10645 [Planctomycetaceae bacterium]|nr:hypothetical protein [Planctomycetaceae bacterium]
MSGGAAPGSAAPGSAERLGSELGARLDAELAARRVARAYGVLEEFVAQCLLERRAAWGQGVLDEVRPVARFQLRGGTSHLAAVKAAVELLVGGAGAELALGYDLLEQRDRDGLLRLLADPRSVVGAETVGRVAALRLHRDWLAVWCEADGAKAAAGSANSMTTVATSGVGAGERSAARRDAAALALRLEEMARRLERAGEVDLALLADVTGAELLEAVGDGDGALERWIRIGQSAALLRAEPSSQVAVAGRIRGWRDRVRDEVTQAIRTEERAAVRAELERLEAENQSRAAAFDARVAELEAELVRSGAAADERQRAALAQLRADGEAELRQRAARIRELEDALVRIAETAVSGRSAEVEAEITEVHTGAREGLAVAADFLAIWGAARALRRASAKG